MTQRRFHVLVPLAALLAVAACEHAKSSNPLSPTIAGPLPGVEITQPVLLEPGQGVKFKDRQQPITLLVENASSNGVRPLLYGFQVAVDAGFTNLVFSRQDVAQGGNGRTSLKLPSKLPLGRTYYWRAWAYDGANTGQMASSMSFDVYPPVTISPPVLVSPARGSSSGSVTPVLTLRNSARTGPAGNITYHIQVSGNQAFTQVAAANARQPENPGGQTSWMPLGLAHSKTYYWRAQGSDGETTGGWSAVSSFTTPGASPAPGGPTGNPCSASDELSIVACRRAQYPTLLSPSQAPALLAGIAHDLNARRGSTFYGRLSKTSGNNCGGYSCDIICATNGDHWDVLIAGPDASANYSGPSTPAWNYVGKVDASRCRVVP